MTSIQSQKQTKNKHVKQKGLFWSKPMTLSLMLD